MSPESSEYLDHVLDEADYLIGQTKALSREAFLADETRVPLLRDQVERMLRKSLTDGS